MRALHLKSKIGILIIIILTSIPLIMWYQMIPLKLRFGSRYGSLISFGDMCSLTGMPLFAMSIILSGRFKFMEDYFGGMNRIYIIHHIIGGIGFLFLMIHPLFMALSRAMISYHTAALFLLPGADWSVNFGIIALYSIMTLLILTYFVKLKYNLWKITHKFMGAAFFSGGLHAMLIDSDLSRNSTLKAYILGLAAIAILVYIYRTLLGEWLVKKYSYTVTYAAQLTSDSWKIEMKPIKKMMNYHAGQFIFIQFLGKGVNSEWHPFSISSSVNEGIVDIIIKAEGDYSKTMNAVKPGVMARIEGPFGRFYPEKKEAGQIWIAGGIGITPFLSLAKTLDAKAPSIDLYYVVRGAKEAVGYPRLLQLADKIEGLRVCLYDTTVEKGRINANVIKEMSGDIMKREIFICGPPPMMKSLKNQFLKERVPASRIHTEEFSIQ